MTFLKALKDACLRLKIVKIHLQKAEMNELVAAAGLWKYRCDMLKREVMDQVKGMGDKMDWDTYYPEGRSPLDDVPGPVEQPRQGLQNFAEERSQPVQRSTIDRILEGLNKGCLLYTSPSPRDS